MRSAVPFFVWSAGALVLLWHLTPRIPNQALAVTLLFVALCFIPSFFAGAYTITVGRTLAAARFKERGWLYWLSTRRLLRLLLWSAVSLLSTFVMVFYLSQASATVWILLVFAIPAFYYLHRLLLPILLGELRPIYARERAVHWARLAMAGLLAAALLVLESLFQPETALSVASDGYVGASESHLIAISGHLLAAFQTTKVSALAHLSELDSWLFLVAAFLLHGTFFFGALMIFSWFLLPQGELKRLLAPVTDCEEIPVIAPASAYYFGFFFTIGFLVVIPYLTFAIETGLQARPQILEGVQTGRVIYAQRLEQIGDSLYEEGTIADIEILRHRTIRQLDASVEGTLDVAARGFDLMAGRVDDYLDWYYSLPAEYARLGVALTGNLESYLGEQMQTHLLQDEPFAALQERLNSIADKHASARQEYEQSLNALLAERLVENRGARHLVTAELDLQTILSAPDHPQFSNVEGRLITSGGMAIGIGAAVSAKLVSKIAGKGVFKAVSIAATKVLAGKLAGGTLGAAAGSTVGATIGSIVPGFGNAAGAVVGGAAVAIAVAFTVDAAMLGLEEAYSRDRFKKEILDALAQTESEFTAMLNGA